MKVIKQPVYRLDFSETTEERFKAALKLSDNVTILYSRTNNNTSINGYKGYLRKSYHKNKEWHLELVFGCITINTNELKLAISALEGKNTKEHRKVLIKKTSPDGKHLKQNVIEQSENFFITDKKKCYPKEDYEIRTIIVDNSRVSFTPSSIIFRDRNICKNRPTQIQKILEILKYFLMIIEGTNQFLNDKGIE